MATASPSRALAEKLTLQGNELYFAGECGDALKHYQEAYDLTGDAIAANNVAIALIHLARFDESMDWAKRAYELSPNDWRTRTVYGETLIRDGQWLEAWKFWQPLIENPVPVSGVGVQWEQGMDLKGKEVIVFNGGGFGDVFMFSRYVPEVAKRFGCKVTFCTTEELVPVFVNQPSMAGVNFKEKRNWDVWMHLFHFPLLFQMTPETVLWNGPYIEPIDVFPSDRIRIGLKLAAGEKGDKFKFRSVPGFVGEDLLKAIPKRVKLVALTQSNPLVNSWLDTIALTSTCDLVIGVDTATIHLAGAMGKPTWVILGDFNDAKYLNRGDSAPWYPTMKVFRGEGKGYKHSVDQVIKELGTWLPEQRRTTSAPSI